MKTWFDMSVKNGIGEIIIFDEIGLWGISAKMFKEQLDALGNVASIKIRINSPGGDVMDGFAIYNMLRENKAEKEITIDGYAASIASIIAMAATKLIMPENTFLMIHNPWMYTVGDANTLREDADLLDKMKANAIKAYQSRAKELTDKELSDMMDATTWLTAEDAQLYGFADEVISAISAQNSINTGKLELPDNVKKALMIVNKSTKQPPVEGKGVNVMNKCPKCGKDVTAEAGFCNHCGANMKADPVLVQAHEKEIAAAKAEGEATALARVLGIQSRCDALKIPKDETAKFLASKEPIEKIYSDIIEMAGKAMDLEPAAPLVAITKDAKDKFRKGAVNSICAVSGLEKDKKILEEVSKEDLPYSMHTLIRACLQNEGQIPAGKIMSMSGEQLHREAIRMQSNIGSSDLPSIMADVANKSVQAGIAEEPTTYQMWTAEGEVPDFKNVNLVSYSNYGDMEEIKEGADFTQGKIQDKKETASIKTYGRGTVISRQAIINDDMNALTDIPRLMTRAQFRKINQALYDLLTSNSLIGPTMTEDGVALFDASSHVNLIDPSNIPSLTTLGVARKALRNILALKAEKGAKAVPTGAMPRYIIAGTSNEQTIENIVYNQALTQVSGTTTVNPYAQGGRASLTPVIDAYLQTLLTANSKEYAWYLAADQGQLPTFKLFFLRGNRVPTFRTENSSVNKSLGIAMDTYFDWGWGLQDWRGLVYNDGAAT